MRKVSTVAILLLLLPMLIFTPHTQSNPAHRPGDGVNAHVRQRSVTNETRIEFWTQLIAFIDCPHVVLLDSFEFFANRPALARRLFAGLNGAGVRVSAQRQLRLVKQLPPVTHRLAIIVPIVMKPSKPSTVELDTFIAQIAAESNFVEFYRWIFVFGAAHSKSVWHALEQLPIRADSHVYGVTVDTGKAVPFDDRIHLERKMMPADRFVRRMQMLPPHHPEAANRTLAVLTLPGPNAAPARVAMWQLYRLQTRKHTIGVAVELLETDAMGRMVLYRGLAPEQRNDFFGLTDVTIQVYASAARHINLTTVAESIPLFRNASTSLSTYWFGHNRKRVDLHFQLISTNHFNKRLNRWYAYSLPLFQERLAMYINRECLSYHEQSSKILLYTLLPASLLGLLLCLSLLLAYHTANSRPVNHSKWPSVSFADTLIWMIGVFAQQGTIIRPNSSSSMIITLVALLLSTILYCNYVTNISSQLSVHVDVDFNLQTLLSGRQYQVGFVGNYTPGQTVTKRYNPALAEIIQRMLRDNSLFSISYEHGLQRALNSKYVLIGSVGSVRKAMESLDDSQRCNLTKIKLEGIEHMAALQIPAGYQYRKMFQYEILRYYANGNRNRIEKRIIPNRHGCVTNKHFHPVSLSNVTVQMYMLKVGWSLAAIVLGIELVYRYFKNMKCYKKVKNNREKKIIKKFRKQSINVSNTGRPLLLNKKYQCTHNGINSFACCTK